MLKVFKNGLATGMLLQLAIGPVFFYITNLSLQSTVYDGFAGVLAVTIVDYFYITLAILGVGKLLENKKIKTAFGIISSIVLILFGLILIRNIFGDNAPSIINNGTGGLVSSFTSTFALTISSPLGIVFWTGLFASKVIECNYSKKELLIFGFSTGLATLLFMGSSVILFSLIKGAVPSLLIKLLNVIVGCLLIGYGGIRLVKILKN